MRRIFIALAVILSVLGPQHSQAVDRRAIVRTAARPLDLRRVNGVTLVLDNSRPLTYDANNRVSSWASRVGSISFAQGTDSAKPILSRSDNRENRVASSDDITSSLFSFNRLAKTSATLITSTASTGAHNVYQQIQSYAGELVVASVKLKRENYDYAWFGQVSGASQGVNVNLATGVIDASNGVVSSSISAADTEGYYTVTISITNVPAAPLLAVYFSSAGSSVGPSLTLVGTETMSVKNWSWRSPAADSTYLANPLATPQYRGINGLPTLVFNGSSSVMTSTATLANIISASANTSFFAVQGNVQAANGSILFETNGVFYYGYRADAKFRSTIYDGGSKIIEAAWPSGTARIWEHRHDTGKSYLSNRIDADPAAVDAGNVTTLTGTLALGGVNATTQLFNGRIMELVAASVSWPQPIRARVYKELRKRSRISGAG